MFTIHPSTARLAVLLLAFGVGPISAAAAQDGHDHAAHAHGQATHTSFSGDAYLLGVDPVSGKDLGPAESQITIRHEGRELRFSGPKQADAFQARPEQYVRALDREIARQQLLYYPLDTCLVSGEKLGGSMGTPVDFVHLNRLVRFCCNGCKPQFLKDPSRYISQLDAAVVKAQGPRYGLDTCVVSGEKLGGAMGAPIDHVVGNRLVRFCCKGCRKDFDRDPVAHLLKLEGVPLRRAQHGTRPSGGHEHGSGSGDAHHQGHGAGHGGGGGCGGCGGGSR